MPTVGGVVTVPIGSLLAADSPRESGEDPDHTRGLAEVMDLVPPIVVHRRTMRVIDGMHRLRAAELCGQTLVRVRYFEGGEDDAFVLGVQMNAQHGLPLTLAERTKAAVRILGTHPYWSDRLIGSSAGLSPRTVSELRRSTADPAHSNGMRVGRDGRVRPTDVSRGRMRARELLLEQPTMTVREVAQEAGISVGTAHSVHKGLRVEREQAAAGADGAAADHGTGGPGGAAAGPGDGTGADDGRGAAAEQARVLATALEGLRRDPSLRGSIAGRLVLRQLAAAGMDPERWSRLAAQMPRHCVPGLVVVARACARSWSGFADRLESTAGDV